jgi:uncharacterized membrane protein (DUF2068 family)
MRYEASMDWNLRACGRHGHATYAPSEDHLRERLRVQTPVGEAWRCLRCGDFVPGPARGHGPAERAPVVRRGMALRDAVILRLLAVERFTKGLLVLLASYGVFRLRANHDAVQRTFRDSLPLLQPIANKIGWNMDDSSIVHTIGSVIQAESRTLLWVTVALAVYGCLQLAEGLGLWLLKRWGEYFAVVATSLFIPVEIYELTERLTITRIATLVINIAAVLYIAVSKRLFGLRGGRAAHEAQRHEMGLLEVESSAVYAGAAGAGAAGAGAAISTQAGR